MYMSLSHLYALLTLIKCLYLRFTYSFTSNCNVFVSISRLRAFEDLEFDFVIAFIGFYLPLIYFTFTISLRLYACRRHIISIIKRFFCVIPNLTKYSYNNLEFIQRIKGKSILKTLLIINLIKALILKFISYLI